MNADQLKGILGSYAVKDSRYYAEGQEEDAYHEMMWEIDGHFSKPQTLQAKVAVKMFFPLPVVKSMQY